MVNRFFRLKGFAVMMTIALASLVFTGCSKKIAPVSGSAGVTRDGGTSTAPRSSSRDTMTGDSAPGISDDMISSDDMTSSDNMDSRGDDGPARDEMASLGSGRDSRDSRGSLRDGMPGMRGMASDGPRFLENVYFDFDKSVVRNDAKDILSENARWLAVNSDVLIQIEGHGDERGTNDYNLALGERRARSIMRYLVNLGIRESRFSFISYGEERGVCSDKTEDCYQKNRRVHFIVKK